MARRSYRVTVRRKGGSRRRYARRRRFYGKRKAASQQKQRAHFIVKSTFTGFIRIDPVTPYVINAVKQFQNANVGGSAVLSVYRNLMKSNYFNNIRSMYDQVRVNSCKVTIIPTQSVVATGVKQAIFVSAWDRNGVNQSEHPPGFSEIAAHSSAFQKPLNLDTTAWKATRKISVSTLAEKSAWIATGPASNQSGNGSALDISAAQVGSYSWNPQLLIGILVSPSSANTLPSPQTWGYVAQFEWSLTFRGLRYDVADQDGVVQQVQAIVNPLAAPSVGSTTVPYGEEAHSTTTVRMGTLVDAAHNIDLPEEVYETFSATNWSVSSPFAVDTNQTYYNTEGSTATIVNTNTQPNEYTVFVVHAYGWYHLSDREYETILIAGFSLLPNERVTITIPSAERVRHRFIFSSESTAHAIGFSFGYSVYTNPASFHNKSEMINIPPGATGKLFEKYYGPALVNIRG